MAAHLKKNLKLNLVPRFTRKLSQVVSSHNEWGPLEEIIVGRIDDPIVPCISPERKANIPKHNWSFFEENAGKRFPSDHVKKAREEVENLCRVIEGEGVKVRRPDKIVGEKGFETPVFQSSTSFFNACPRDFLLVIGNKLIEAPMASRCRYFEFQSYRTLINEYFKQGAQWIAAPKLLMSEELYESDYPYEDEEARVEWAKAGRYAITDHEPCFDAAEFFRCGRDIFTQRSHVTNYSGIEWLKRQLGEEYNVHILPFEDVRAYHIDASMFIPKPGIVVFNPNLNFKDFGMFERAGWKIMLAPSPTTPDSHPLWFASNWLSMSTLMLDTERVIVEAQEYPTQKFFESIGLKCIKVPFRHCYSFGGGIHCFTCDVRRRGELESYF